MGKVQSRRSTNAGRDLEARLTRALEPRLEILDAYLFGSQARGDAGALSDIDVAVFIDQDLAEPGPYGYDAELITDLMTELGTNDIDVVLLNQAPPLLYHRVLRDGKLLVTRDLAATTTRAGYALSRYFDFVPQMEKQAAARRYANRNREA
jgi:hypothetical protein